MDSKPVRLDVYRTAIAMRRFEHAAATRDLAQAVVVRLELERLKPELAEFARQLDAVKCGRLEGR